MEIVRVETKQAVLRRLPRPGETERQVKNQMKAKQDAAGKRSNEEMLRSGSYGQMAVKLCVPSILIMLVMVIYHMADVFFVGQAGDPNMVAAVSLASPMFSILSGLGVLLGNGGCTAQHEQGAVED